MRRPGSRQAAGGKGGVGAGDPATSAAPSRMGMHVSYYSDLRQAQDLQLQVPGYPATGEAFAILGNEPAPDAGDHREDNRRKCGVGGRALQQAEGGLIPPPGGYGPAQIAPGRSCRPSPESVEALTLASRARTARGCSIRLSGGHLRRIRCKRGPPRRADRSRSREAAGVEEAGGWGVEC